MSKQDINDALDDYMGRNSDPFSVTSPIDEGRKKKGCCGECGRRNECQKKPKE